MLDKNLMQNICETIQEYHKTWTALLFLYSTFQYLIHVFGQIMMIIICGLSNVKGFFFLLFMLLPWSPISNRQRYKTKRLGNVNSHNNNQYLFSSFHWKKNGNQENDRFFVRKEMLPTVNRAKDYRCEKVKCSHGNCDIIFVIVWIFYVLCSVFFPFFVACFIAPFRLLKVEKRNNKKTKE